MRSRATGNASPSSPFLFEEWIMRDDPDHDRKMADRLAGREPGKRSMLGPYGFAQFDLAPDWWRKRQLNAARKIAKKHGPPEILLHPQVFHHLNRP